jgi:predicted small lipoprotein YifL
MKKILVVFMVLIFSLLACGKKSPPPESKSESPSVPKVIVEKEKVEKERPLPPEVKIKLKKDGKDSYSWELAGSDVDQILKVNEKLRKQLGGERPR